MDGLRLGRSLALPGAFVGACASRKGVTSPQITRNEPLGGGHKTIEDGSASAKASLRQPGLHACAGRNWPIRLALDCSGQMGASVTLVGAEHSSSFRGV